MSNLVVDSEVSRREDGYILTLYFADDRVEERYLSAAEIADLKTQLDAALSAGGAE